MLRVGIVIILLGVTLGSNIVHPTVNPEYNPCPENWFHYGERCYLWSGTDEKENWFKAELECRSIGSHLVSLESEEEAKVVRGVTFCDNAHWIGLVNVEFEQKTIMDKNSWVWWDETVHNYTRLTPVNTAGYYCGYAKEDGTWTSNYCSHISLPWVCEKPERKRDGKLLPRPKATCPTDWVERDGLCYFFSNGTANYFHAQLDCQEKGAHVAYIENKFEQAFLQAFMGCNSAFWIGLVNANPCVSEANGHRCWQWSNLSPVEYRNWKNVEPSSATIECAYSKGYWDNNVGCDKLMAYVCKKRAL